jgi:glycerol-3-phosphate dehydrogenase (NAD(P)+)
VPLSDNGHEVALVGTHLDGDIIAALRAGRPHPRLGISAPARVTPHTHDELQRVFEKVDIVVLGVSSPGVPWAASRLAPLLRPHLPVVALTKGMAVLAATLRILPEAFAALLPTHLHTTVPVTAIGGPCIAGELAVRRQTAVTLAGHDRPLVERIVAMLANDYYHVHPSPDLVGLEICAAFKNFYAIAVGASRGFQEKAPPAANSAAMHNPEAALFAQALAELAHLVERLGGRAPSAWGLPGAGDLYVTAQSGRNARLGRWLGLGLSYEEAKGEHMAGETIEGAELALTAGPTLRALMERSTLDAAQLPLMRSILAAVCDGAPLAPPWAALSGAECV